jgi:hypothetical protein
VGNIKGYISKTSKLPRQSRKAVRSDKKSRSDFTQ